MPGNAAEMTDTTTNAIRNIVTFTPRYSANPAQTPAIILLVERVRRRPLTILPLYAGAGATTGTRYVSRRIVVAAL